MKAILFADRQGETLSPLTDRICMALLPVLIKPLIYHSLDTLSIAQIREVIIVISQQADEVEIQLASGDYWGMQLTYMLSRGQESPAKVLARLGSALSDSEYLIMRADILRSFDIEAFLEQASQLVGSVLATIDGQNAGVGLFRNADHWESSNMLDWSTWKSSLSEKEGMTILPMVGDLCLLNSLLAYHQVHFEALSGRFLSIIVPGAQLTPYLKVGHRAVVNEQNHQGLVGAFCHVHAQAKLNNVVLSEHVTVGQQAALEHTVVLPWSYLGEGIELRNAIVWGNVLIRVDTGAVVHVVDHFLLTDVRNSGFQEWLIDWGNRVLGMLALIGSLPLWPLAIGLAMWQNANFPLREIELVGNLRWHDANGVAHRQKFTTWEWNVKVPILRHLPKLLAVLQGNMAMVGVRPLSPQQLEFRQVPWQRVRDLAPVGLLGPSQLGVPRDAPREEHWLVEAHYAKTRSLIFDTRWLVQGVLGILSKRAWSTVHEDKQQTSSFL